MKGEFIKFVHGTPIFRAGYMSSLGKCTILLTLVVAAVAALVPTDSMSAPISLPVAKDDSTTLVARTIVEPTTRFSVVIPQGWVRSTIKISGVRLMVQSNDKKRFASCNVRVAIDERLRAFDSGEYLERVFRNDDPTELIEQYRAEGLVPKLIRSGRIAIAGVEGVFVEIDTRQQNMEFRTFNVQFLKANSLYTLGCIDTRSQYQRSLPEFGFIVSTIRTAD